jgi:DNA primase
MHKSLKDRILELADIVEIIGEKVSLRRQGRNYVGLCPFHDDHKPSMSVSAEKQIFKCWSCGAGGDVIKFVQMRERVEFAEALSLLAQRLGIEPSGEPSAAASGPRRDELRAALAWAATHFQRNLASPAGAAACRYAARRGINDQTLRRYTLGLAFDSWDDIVRAAGHAGVSLEVLQHAGVVASGDSGKTFDRFRNRLMFPIRDPSGRVIAFGGRTLGDDPAKYLNSPESPLFSKGRVLYGLDAARGAIERERTAIVVEGYMDTVLLHQNGIDNVVATLGTALTDAHVRLLAPRADRLLLCFDGDAAGLKAAERAAELGLRTGLDVAVVLMPDGRDPADCVVAGGRAAFEAVLRTAVNALEFKWQRTAGALEASGSRARRAAVDEFLRFASSVVSRLEPVQRSLIASRLSAFLEIPPAAVFEMISKARPARGSAPAEPAAANEPADGSEYSVAVRGLPAGLVTAAEALLGLALSPEGYDRLRTTVESVRGMCPVWERLAAICEDVWRRSETATRAAIIERCEEPALCELVSRACQKVEGVPMSEESFHHAEQRLLGELAALQMERLQAQLRAAPASPGADEAYRALLAAAGRERAVAPAASRSAAWSGRN